MAPEADPSSARPAPGPVTRSRSVIRSSPFRWPREDECSASAKPTGSGGARRCLLEPADEERLGFCTPATFADSWSVCERLQSRSTTATSVALKRLQDLGPPALICWVTRHGWDPSSAAGLWRRATGSNLGPRVADGYQRQRTDRRRDPRCSSCARLRRPRCRRARSEEAAHHLREALHVGIAE